uniref:Uncharacterized protein n=1 Tax=Rhizophora mucronata TaxID=61149 RepID=A0A2P2MZL5_RHIMU
MCMKIRSSRGSYLISSRHTYGITTILLFLAFCLLLPDSFFWFFVFS